MHAFLISLVRADGNCDVNVGKNEEIIYSTYGYGFSIFNGNEFMNFDLKLFRDKMIISSLKETVIKDNFNNIYKVDEFEYFVNQEILKGKKIEATTINENNDSDTYIFQDGFFDLKKNEFLAKDIKILFDKKSFGNNQNDPRLKAVTGYG